MKRLSDRTHARAFLLALALPFLTTNTAEAQNAMGTVEGTVTDVYGGLAAGASVEIAGTSISTVSNPDGFYRLTFVPAGAHEVRFRVPSGQAWFGRDVWVVAGEVLLLDLDAAAPEAAAAEGDLPLPFSATSGSFTSGNDVDRLPVSDPVDVLRLDPGVTSGRADALVLRGSRPTDVTTFVDGVPVRSMDTGDSPLGLAPNTLTQTSSRTGLLGAAWGDAQAGALSYVTAFGRPSWRGSLAYESDGLQGASTRLGMQRLEATVGGRLLGRLTLFAGGAATTQQAAEPNIGVEGLPVYAYGPEDTVLSLPVNEDGRPDTVSFTIPQFVQYGGACVASTADTLDPGDSSDDPCLGRRRPRAWESDSRWNAKLQFDIGGGSFVTFSGLTQTRQAIDWTYAMHEEGRPGHRTTSSVLALDWVQRIVRRPGGALTLQATVSSQRDRINRGATQEIVDLHSETPSLSKAFDGLDLVVDFDRFGSADPAQHLTRDSTGGWTLARLQSGNDWDAAIENVRYHRGTLRPYLGWTELVPTSDPRVNPYSVIADYPRTGLDFGQLLVDERRAFGRAVLDWQTRRYRLRGGFESTWGRVRHWESDWTTLEGGEIYSASPHKTAAFLAVTGDFELLRLDIGLRLDWFDPGTNQPLVPGRTFTHPAFDPEAPIARLTCSAKSASDCDGAEQVWVGSPTTRTLSPSVRAVFPIRRGTSLRLGYGHQVQAPPLSVLAAGANNDVSVAGNEGLFGGTITPSRTILYEVGARQSVGRGFVLDAAAYFKDLRDQFAYRFLPVYDPVLDSIVDRRLATNADYGYVRGIDLSVAKRWGDWLAIRAAYSFASVRSTGSDPTDYIFGLAQLVPSADVDTVPPPDTPLPTRDERQHQISGTVTALVPHDFARGTVVGAVLSDLGVFLAFRIANGLPYTLFENISSGVRSNWGQLSALRAVDDWNHSRTSWERYLDLRVSKGLRIGPAAIEIYGDVRNLLGLENTPVVFAETRNAQNELHRETLVDQQLSQMYNDTQWRFWTEIPKSDPDGSNPRIVGAMDLRDLSDVCSRWYAQGGTPACVMLERAERRFGNGDGYYDVEEQEAAVQAWYDSQFSAPHFAGAGPSVRFGLRVGF